MDVTFLGATGTVTGSKYLVEVAHRRVLVDCGLFQGDKSLRLRNWAPLPVRPSDVDAIVLTHAHIDHSGYLPAFVRDGFAGRVFCSEATRDLCAILLADTAHLQEEDAAYANRKGFSKHRPARPLYNAEDARAALARFTPIAWDHEHYLGAGLAVRLAPVGHILGAASVRVSHADGAILFSGDVGRPHDPLLNPPAPPLDADAFVVESTYGGRSHETASAEEALGEAIRRVAARSGVVIVPAFAVGRAQTLLYFLHRLKARHAIPDVPVFLNSPMATDATDILCRHRREHRLDPATCAATCHVATLVGSANESRALNERRGPMVILSASGMLSGGRVLHHLKRFAPDPRNAILLVGYQGAGTRGAALVNGARSLRIHGEDVPIRAEVVSLPNLSAHADAAEMIAWLRQAPRPPRVTYVTHGELASSAALATRIFDELGWRAEVPRYCDRVTVAPRGGAAVASAVVRDASAADDAGCAECEADRVR